MGACVQNGATVCCMDTVLEPVVDKELEFWTSLSPRKANSCQVSRVCVASVKVELRALVTDSTFKRYACGFRAAHLVSPLTCSSHCSSLIICCRQRQQSSKDRSLFRSYSSSIVVHGSESFVIFAKDLLTTHLAPPNTSVSTRPLYFTLGSAITLETGIHM